MFGDKLNGLDRFTPFASVGPCHSQDKRIIYQNIYLLQFRLLAAIPTASSPETGQTSRCESDKLSRSNIPFASSE